MDEKNFDREQYAQLMSGAVTNRANTYNLNSIQDYYQIDPGSGGMIGQFSGKAFEAGSSLEGDLSARRNQAMQTAMQMYTGVLNREQTERLEETKNSLNVLGAQFDAIKADRQAGIETRGQSLRLLSDALKLQQDLSADHQERLFEIRNSPFLQGDANAAKVADLVQKENDLFDTQRAELLNQIQQLQADVGLGGALSLDDYLGNLGN